MKKIIFALLALLAMCLPASDTIWEVKNPEESVWFSAFENRARVIEEKFGVKFDAKWKPKVEFARPESFPPTVETPLAGRYIFATQSFLVSPRWKSDVRIALIDHELGHALADQVSRRIGNGAWPGEWNGDVDQLEEMMARNFISEGIAEYFENIGKRHPKRTKGGYKNLPESWFDQELWRNIYRRYEGSYWIVQPILKRHGIHGLVYLMTHPFKYSLGGNVRGPALEYQKKAMEDLKKMTS